MMIIQWLGYRMESNTEKSNFYSLCLTDAGEFWYGYTKDQLHGLRCYLSVMEEFISKSESKELSYLEKQSDMLSDQSKGNFWAMNYPVYWEEIFANNLRNSVILLLYKILEPYISILCRDIGKTTKIKLEDMKGGGSLYERIHKYLEEVGKFQSPTEKEWEVVINIYALRNMITHDDNSNEKNEIKMIKALMKIEALIMNKATGLSMSSDGMLSIGKEFCEYALTNIDKFVDALYESAMIIFRTAESDARSKLKHFQEK